MIPGSRMQQRMRTLTEDLLVAQQAAYINTLRTEIPKRFMPGNARFGIPANQLDTTMAKIAKGQGVTPLVASGRLRSAIRVANWHFAYRTRKSRILRARLPAYASFLRRRDGARPAYDWLRLTKAETRQILAQAKRLAAQRRKTL